MPGGGGGGGGGYYGGGGGGGTTCTGGGGGGSSYVAPSARTLVDSPGRNLGNGYVIVSWPAAVVTFIGDSVTAGFGYCGIAENAAHVSCPPNQEMANAWVAGDNSLKDCAPPDPLAALNDACSNDNDNGMPWHAPAWTPGPTAPRIAYPYQIAASQGTAGGAAVSDWAVTGSTPADWDPAGGVYGPQIEKLNNQYVVMTLGANPILSSYTNIDFNLAGIPDVHGSCVGSTGYQAPGAGYGFPVP